MADRPARTPPPPPRPSARPWDLVLFGATGFTGRLVAEVIRDLGPAADGLRWALAGRDGRRLEALHQSLGLPPSVGIVQADAGDAAALRRLAAQTRLVLTTAGPYQRLGGLLVQACAAACTDTVDLCGEPLWMAQMIDACEADARASGARIVFSCGFDSVPFDLGVVFLQHAMQQRLGAPAREIRASVQRLDGGFSGGTVASALGTAAQAAEDPTLAQAMDNPFLLTPGFTGPPQADPPQPVLDDWQNTWTSPFVMSAINTKNVHRTHALRGHPWGTDFVYRERQDCGPGWVGRQRAWAQAGQAALAHRLLAFKPSRELLGRWALPQPGTGPSAAARARGGYAVVFTGATAQGQRLSARVVGEGDPGYASTSRIITQAALCLLGEVSRQATPGGVWTAGAAMGLALQRRLQAHAGLRFEVVAPTTENSA